RKGAVERVMVVPNNTLREEILHFARCIEYNSSAEHYPNRADGTLGANVVRVLETTKSLLRRNARSKLKFLAANLYLLMNRCLDYTRSRRVWGASERTSKITIRVEELMTGVMACVRITR